MVVDRKFYSQKELAEYFGKKAVTVIEWEKSGMPVYRPVNGHPMYDLDEVLAWMKQNGEKAQKGE